MFPQAHDEKEEMESLRKYNMKLVANILPVHVAEHFLKAQNKKDEVRETHDKFDALSLAISLYFIVRFWRELQ